MTASPPPLLPLRRPHEKLMGQVLVPASHRVSCEVEALPADQEQQLRRLLLQLDEAR